MYSIGLTCMYLPVSPLAGSMISTNIIIKLQTNSMYVHFLYLNN